MEFRGPRNRQINREPQHKINELIKAPTVRVVGENIEPGVYPLREALAMAEAAGADLVEISPNAEPPVCRIIEYSKFLYQLKKKQKEIKVKHAKGFLEEGAKVRAYVFFKGRSILFKEQGTNILDRFIAELEEYGKVEAAPKLEGKKMIVVLAPKK